MTTFTPPPKNNKCRRNLQDPDSVGRPSALPPPSDADHSVSGLDEPVLLAKVDPELDPVVDVLSPVLCPALGVEEGHHAPEDLHGAGGLGAAGDGQEGALGPVLGGDEGRPAGGGQADDGGGSGQVGRLDGGDGGGGRRVVLHVALLYIVGWEISIKHFISTRIFCSEVSWIIHLFEPRDDLNYNRVFLSFILHVVTKKTADFLHALSEFG